MSINVKLLAQICEIPGTSGFEHDVRNFVKKELKGIVDEMYTDHMGNLIALKKGQSDKKRVMAAAHMDEIGFIVTHIDEKGFRATEQCETGCIVCAVYLSPREKCYARPS